MIKKKAASRTRLMQSMFAKSKHHHLNIVNMAFMKHKHGTCEA